MKRNEIRGARYYEFFESLGNRLSGNICRRIGGTTQDQSLWGKSCGGCHFEQYMIWKKQARRDLDALSESYKTDPNCIKCHTTGWNAIRCKDSSTPTWPESPVRLSRTGQRAR
jgi:hypothetical protein